MPEPVAAAIALGSNLGDRAGNLRTAIAQLGLLGKVTAVSSFHATEPVGYLDQPEFLNAAVLLETPLAPHALLEALLAIERDMGRVRIGVPAKGPRLIDLDLLLYGGEIVESATLTLPHPAMHERPFVLAPLAEIAPGWKHPILHQTIATLLQAQRMTRKEREKGIEKQATAYNKS